MSPAQQGNVNENHLSRQGRTQDEALGVRLLPSVGAAGEALFSLQGSCPPGPHLDGGDRASKQEGLVVMVGWGWTLTCVPAEGVGKGCVLFCKGMRDALLAS